jgi:hypothetical protein
MVVSAMRSYFFSVSSLSFTDEAGFPRDDVNSIRKLSAKKNAHNTALFNSRHKQKFSVNVMLEKFS